MPKYLLQANYTAEGMQGLTKEGASGRRAAVKTAIEGIGGKMEAFYYAFGADDAIVIVDLPSNVAAAAVGIATSATGSVRLRTTPLLTIEDIDKALALKPNYRPPGKKKLRVRSAGPESQLPFTRKVDGFNQNAQRLLCRASLSQPARTRSLSFQKLTYRF
jgi:uncharacterized protein with GYD domain